MREQKVFVGAKAIRCSLNIVKCEALTIVSFFFPLFSSFTSVNQTGSNKERKIEKEFLLQDEKW